MDVESAQSLLRQTVGTDEPVHLPLSLLDRLSPSDLPDGVRLGVGVVKDGVTHVEWSAHLLRRGQTLIAEVDHTWTRKYWYSPLNLEHYLDLVRRAVSLREARRGDVALVHHDDDGAYVHLLYEIELQAQKTLGGAWREARRTAAEVEEPADYAVDEIAKAVEAAARRVDGWGELDLASLVDEVETSKSPNAKGLSLEELVTRLFEAMPGLSATGRIITSTEELDITILNGSQDPRLAREKAVILVECKNWSSRCGKNEFVVFKSKLDNRSARCSLGFLVSWNGFAETVTREMLRGSREETLIVPIDGRQIRAAVRDDCFDKMLFEAWQKAVLL